MKITKEYLLSRGFEIKGEEEGDSFFHMQFKYDTNNICPQSLTGSLEGDGFDLYGYGFVKDQKHLSTILGAISVLAGTSIRDIIKK